MRILWVLEKYFDIALDKSARLEMIKSLTSRGHEVILLTGYKSHKEYYGLKSNIKYIFSIKFIGFHFLTLSISIFLYSILAFRRWKPNVILCCPLSVLPLIPINLFVKLFNRKIKFVMDIRSIKVEVNTLMDRISAYFFNLGIRWAGNSFDGITVISPFMKKAITKTYRIDEKRIGVWSSGVSLEHFNPHRLLDDKIYEIKSKLNLHKKFVVMYHGVLTPNRGLQSVIKTMDSLKNSHKDVMFVIIGTGIAKSTLQELIRSYQIADKVKLIDAVSYDEIPYYIALCDIGILPFPNLMWWRVSSPIKLMEYLAMEKPVIATDIEAHRDVINSQMCGFIIQSNDPSEIKKAIMKAYKLRETLLSYGKTGRDIVLKRYTWQSQAVTLENYLCTLV